MDGDLLNFLKHSKIFASLESEPDVFQALLKEFEKMTLKDGDVLFRQGDSAEYFFILGTGKLSAILSMPNAKPKIVGYIRPGESVGELGALSGEARTLTVKAVEDSTLWRLPEKTFKKLCAQYPSILLETIHPLVTRSRQVIQMLSTGETKKHVAIIPADETVDITQFEAQLKDALRHYKKIAFLSETVINSDNEHETVNTQALIENAEEENHVILYLLKTHETPLSRNCWEKLGKIYVVADGNSKPHFCNFTMEKLHHSRHLLEVRRELILLYRKNTQPYNTQAWLNQANFTLHHNIRTAYAPDYKRLMRFIRGKAIGLVLSGGGAKGWAHMGALRAIFEANIPIDAIGGTSVGALAGGLYALFNDYETIYKKFEILVQASHNVASFQNICWPAISLFQCEDFTLAAKKIFGDAQIENMWLPLFCTTCNLSLYREAIHHSGLFWERVRGSVAVPGIIPPMIINGEIHIDGGVINNLPVNVMREMLGAESRIIAVELAGKTTNSAKYNFPPTLTFKQAFLSKLGLAYRDYRFPPFIETFLHSLLVGSSVKQKENSEAADLLITPDTLNYRMLKVTEAEKNQLIQIGYDTTLEKISTWGLKK